MLPKSTQVLSSDLIKSVIYIGHTCTYIVSIMYAKSLSTQWLLVILVDFDSSFQGYLLVYHLFDLDRKLLQPTEYV